MWTNRYTDRLTDRQIGGTLLVWHILTHAWKSREMGIQISQLRNVKNKYLSVGTRKT